MHRDLKPENLLIVSFSKDINTVRAKLSDFGTSRFVNQTMKMTNKIGTPAFMAPEVLLVLYFTLRFLMMKNMVKRVMFIPLV